MALDQETVRRIAYLARIRVAGDCLDQIAGELDEILTWVELLEEVNTDGVEPMTSVTDVVPQLRSDIVNDGECRKAVLANAPDSEDGFYTVPKVVE